MTLARRGLSLLAAKQAMEQLLFTHHVTVCLLMVEDLHVLAAELAEAGIAATSVHPPAVADVRACA